MSRSSLLGELKIDRGTESRGPGGGKPVWPIVTAVAVGVLLVAALAWYLIAQPDRIPVRAATARAVASGAAGQGAAIMDASGYVVARRQATVSSKVTGKVTEVLVEEGQRVKAGQILARLDDSNARASMEEAQAQLGAGEATVQLAQTALADADIKYRRYRSTEGLGITSEQSIADQRAAFDNARETLAVDRNQLDVAKAGLIVAQRNDDDTIVRAPFSGVVTVKAAQPGEMVSPISAGGGFTRTGICTIVDMDSTEVQVDVAESFINKVSAGMPAVVKLSAYPDWAIPAEVIAVIPTADRSKGTVTVRVALKARDARILPEMGARVTFLGPAPAGGGSGGVQGSVTVPPEAIQSADSETGVVYVINNGVAERRAVRLGARMAEGQVVTAGLRAGEAVAIGDFARLHDGAKLRVTGPQTQNP